NCRRKAGAGQRSGAARNAYERNHRTDGRAGERCDFLELAGAVSNVSHQFQYFSYRKQESERLAVNRATRKGKRKWIVVTITAGFVLGTASLAYAEHTRRWKQSTYEEFLKGTTHGVAVRSDGRLELAPKFTQLADADASYLWAVKLDAKGTPYAAGGSPAKVIRLESNGKATAVFQSADLSAQAIAFDSKGTLYVATSPDGKVYKVSASGEKSVFFEPKTKYIWDLAFAPDGTLFLATGDKGQIFSVTPDGKGELFYSSDEAHIRV